MTDRLRQLVPDLEPLDLWQVHREALRRRRRQHLVIAVALVSALALVVGATIRWWPRAILAEPAATPTSMTPTATTCPTPVPRNGVFEIAGYASGIYWNGGDFYVLEPTLTAEPGKRIGTVPCNIVDIQDKARAIWRGSWPDGSSTATRVGAAIAVQKGSPESCRIAVDMGKGKWGVFQSKEC
ncbi:hypothetical protein M3G03_10615 [Aestuariimicrobium sp. p3-SID1156]|uniref:hypothetical protein n=1 Tax=Aestuariimicrobium sp. p3-SID1156 TaxID=2916038 RepID=UPI00223AFF69|nr:hypothetical protein [Aestuariimicrobium sp. p3-SID1156]MCT1459979.1 hypothetical protein [Aestuariimicrobium sp. p3-SID1156]